MKNLYEMCLQHFNEPLLIYSFKPNMCLEIARCIGYYESAIDCYIIVKQSDGSIRHCTCVGGYYWLDRLKGQNFVVPHFEEDRIKNPYWDDIVRISNDLERHGCNKEAEFILKINHRDQEKRDKNENNNSRKKRSKIK